MKILWFLFFGYSLLSLLVTLDKVLLPSCIFWKSPDRKHEIIMINFMPFTKVLSLKQWASLLEVQCFKLALAKKHLDGSLKENDSPIEVKHI